MLVYWLARVHRLNPKKKISDRWHLLDLLGKQFSQGQCMWLSRQYGLDGN